MKRSKAILILIAAVCVIAVLGFGFWLRASHNDASNGGKPTSPTGMMPQPTTKKDEETKQGNQNPQTYSVSAYFSKHPESDDDPSKVFPVKRTSADLGVAKYAVSQVLQGPTSEESAKGYFSTVQLRSASGNCGTADFTLTVTGGTAQLQFCKPFDHRGVVSDGQAESELKATLLQFGSVKKVVILNQAGDCEFNLSGLNLCRQ